MKNLKRFLSLALALSMLLALNMTAFAAVSDTGFSDVAANAWYADAVRYVRDNGLMNGTSTTAFSPDTTTNLAMVVTILHRDAGTPAASAAVPAGASGWYADAAAWASERGFLANINSTFAGVPITREDMVTVLWRYAGSPAGSAADFDDESSISAYASQAVDWSRANGIVNGKNGNRFDPKGGTTRAELAAILQRFLTLDQTAPAPQPETPSANSRILVAYYSAQGHTKAVAEAAAEALNADSLELIPVIPYADADLNWTVDGSRVNREHENESLRDVKLTNAVVENWNEYDTVLIGYPIWWGIAAWPVNDFVSSNDFTGKTVIPFCTSASSGLGQSGELLKELAGTGNWLEGQRFREGASSADVQAWAKGLNLSKTAPNTPASSNQPAQTASKPLVVYFSMPETTSPNNMTTEEDNSVVVINGEVLGNTQYMAQVIQRTTNADIYRIEPQNPYPTDHTTLVAQAREEQNQDARPAIKDSIANFDSYDTVFIGYPIWWSDLPQILYTFFDTYDFSGKTVIPFSTHGGSSFAGTPATIQRLEPGAKMLDGLTISRNNIQDAEQEIITWVNGLNY